MRAFFLCVIFTAAACGAIDLTKPIPLLQMPDGRILKNVTFANFTAGGVLVRHAGGSAMVLYEFLPPELRPDLEAKRPGGPRVPLGDVSAKKLELKGQLFLQTRGAGAYKMSNVRIYAFDQSALSTWENTRVDPVKLPFPIAETLTDGDGRFKINVPAGTPYFLFAQGARVLSDKNTEWYEWRVPGAEIKKPDEVIISTEWRHQWRAVEIEKLP
ncbi:MAG: hypothetical protein RLZZ15_595 [Verrucomicrobiota bacterium]|jgi:hypothetical protein